MISKMRLTLACEVKTKVPLTKAVDAGIQNSVCSHVLCCCISLTITISSKTTVVLV